MKKLYLMTPWLIILIPFAMLTQFYASLPNEILIARGVFGNEAVFAPKSLFSVFRVPLIEIICALAVEIMRRKFADAGLDYSMWSILLYTVALKSLLQTFEIISSGATAGTFYNLTLGVVIAGLVFALFKGLRSFSVFFRGDLKFSGLEKTLLFAALLAYLGLAIIPILIFK